MQSDIEKIPSKEDYTNTKFTENELRMIKIIQIGLAEDLGGISINSIISALKSNNWDLNLAIETVYQ